MLSTINKESIYIASIKIMTFGIIIFYCGLYILPDVNDMARIFYLLVMLPMLYIAMYKNKFINKNRYFWLLMLLPAYLTLSFIWANPDHITKSASFHFRKLLYIYFFLLAVIFFVNHKQQNLRLLLQALVVLGFASALISLVCFFSKQCGITAGRLSSFSVQDINKAGAMYTVHVALCIFFLVIGFYENKKNTLLINVLLICGVITSAVAIYYARTDATKYMLLILVLVLIVPMWNKKRLVLLFLFFAILASVFFYLDVYNSLMRDASFKVRVKTISVALQQMNGAWVFGLGLTHKLPVQNLPHPHNIFIDVFRFGGIVGLLALVIPMIILCYEGMMAVNKSRVIRFCLAWFIGGIAIMAVYAQQPITRPGGYIWFLYWFPAAILAAELIKLKSIKGSKANG